MKLNCPNCGHVFDAESELENRTACPECGENINLMNLLTVSRDLDYDTPNDPSAHQRALEPGDQLAHFRLLKVLGAGGFGTVFEAFDSRLEREVAVKVPKVARLDEHQAAIFIREAQSAARLQDPNIVSVFEVGRDGQHIFIVSELIRGNTLSKLIKRERMTETQSAETLRVLANAIHRAHEAGIVHRDMKPGNVIVDQQGRPHITDFGLAKLLENNDGTIAVQGRLMGTPQYMSPEQAKGRSDIADRRTDVYALGVIFYELLTGKRPFSSASTTILEEIQRGHITPLRDFNPTVSKDAEAICKKAMAVEPTQRYQTAEDMANDLQAFLDGRPVAARPVGLMGKVQYTARRNLLICSLLAALVVLVGASTYLWFAQTGGSNNQGAGFVQPSRLRPMQISVDPSIKDLVVFPVDENKKVLGKTSLSVESLGAGKFQFEAEPGYHLFRIYTTEGECVEFFRLVPKIDDQKNGAFDLNRSRILLFSMQDEVVVLHEHRLVPSDSPLRSVNLMVDVAGGVIECDCENHWRIAERRGALRPRFPKEPYKVQPFSISQSEVTFRQFFAVMKRPPTGMARDLTIDDVNGSEPVSSVTWLDAIEYAELVGARLPTYFEYNFVATNGGNTPFPSSVAEKPGPWPFGAAIPKDDVSDLGIENLYSSVGEWAWDINLDEEMLVPGVQAPTGHWRDRRLVLGLPLAAFVMVEVKQNESDRPGRFIDRALQRFDKKVGFRIVRSENESQ